MINKEKIAELLDEIKTEDELPSQAGKVFRDIINEQFSGNLGNREIGILSEWLKTYSEMDNNEHQEVADKINELDKEE